MKRLRYDYATADTINIVQYCVPTAVRLIRPRISSSENFTLSLDHLREKALRALFKR